MVRRRYTGPRLESLQRLSSGLASEQGQCFPFRDDYNDLQAALDALRRVRARHGDRPDPARLLGHRS